MDTNTDAQAYVATANPDLLPDVDYAAANAQHPNPDLNLGMDHSNPGLTEDGSSSALASSSLPLPTADVSIATAPHYGYEVDDNTMRILADIERRRQAGQVQAAVIYHEMHGQMDPGLPPHVAELVEAHLQQQRQQAGEAGMMPDLGMEGTAQQAEQGQQSTSSLVEHVQGLQHEQHQHQHQHQEQAQGHALDMGQPQVGQDLVGQEHVQGNGQGEEVAAPPQFYKKRHSM